ncbi:hypothetical protein ACOSQ2_019829 [Xanthoceras sorbifolium]
MVAMELKQDRAVVKVSSWQVLHKLFREKHLPLYRTEGSVKPTPDLISKTFFAHPSKILANKSQINQIIITNSVTKPRIGETSTAPSFFRTTSDFITISQHHPRNNPMESFLTSPSHILDTNHQTNKIRKGKCTWQGLLVQGNIHSLLQARSYFLKGTIS